MRLGRTEVEVPRIGFGTWGHGGPWQVGDRSIGWGGHDDRRAVDALLAGHVVGLRHWDTADVYGRGHAERLIGSLWDRVPRASVFLATKVGWVAGEGWHPYDPRQIRKQLEGSLERLRTDRVDLYYFHRCDFGPEDEYLDDAVECVRRAQEEGKVRFIGLSDWRIPRLGRYLERSDPDVVQVYRNVLDDAYAGSDVARWVEEKRCGVVFFSPLRHGLLLGQDDRPRSFDPGDHRLSMPVFRDRAALSHLHRCRQAVEERFADDPEPVLHALTGVLLSDAPTGVVLLGLRKPEHVRAAARVGRALSPEDARWVRSLYRDLPAGISIPPNPWQG